MDKAQKILFRHSERPKFCFMSYGVITYLFKFTFNLHLRVAFCARYCAKAFYIYFLKVRLSVRTRLPSLMCNIVASTFLSYFSLDFSQLCLVLSDTVCKSLAYFIFYFFIKNGSSKRHQVFCSLEASD